MEHGMRHGEYKVPGGKLVVVDFMLDQQRLTNVRVSGDFFLEPPEALEQINACLENLALDTPRATIIATILQHVPSDTHYFGFSPEAVAIAIERALNEHTQ